MSNAPLVVFWRLGNEQDGHRVGFSHQSDAEDYVVYLVKEKGIVGVQLLGKWKSPKFSDAVRERLILKQMGLG
jgi:hypothetical protein